MAFPTYDYKSFADALGAMRQPTPTAPSVTGVRFDQGPPTLSQYPGENTPESQGRGGPGQGQGTGNYGPLSSSMTAGLRGAQSTLSLGGMMAGLLGSPMAAGILGTLGGFTGPIGATLGASSLAGFFGAKPGFDATLGLLGPMGIRDVNDYFGSYAAADAAARDRATQTERENQRQSEFDNMERGWGNPDSTSKDTGSLGGMNSSASGADGSYW